MARKSVAILLAIVVAAVHALAVSPPMVEQAHGLPGGRSLFCAMEYGICMVAAPA